MYNVLIADDEIEVREGLKLKVDWQASGFQITGEAANGLEAESLLKAGHYDLLITDMSMPVMDGVKLLDVCRSYIPDIRIMIITGYEDFQYARAGVRSQAADYLLKPVTRDDLKSALERIKASLDKERKVRDESEMMQWRLSQYYQEMKGRFLMDLVRGDRIPPSSLSERLRLFHLDAWQESEVCFITAGIRSTRSRMEAGGRDLEQLRLPFHMLCHELAQLHSENIQMFRDHANAATVHCVIARGLQQEFARRLTEQADALLDVDVLIGIGRPVTGLARWKEAISIPSSLGTWLGVRADLPLPR
ncbi:response regulator [Paenibacillus sp. FSL R5-0810]|uniref:response regulator n=1 Tax=Paenibacillus sp. FSL R5-0810 TaxID=2921659 RepID=UPI0030FAC97C